MRAASGDYGDMSREHAVKHVVSLLKSRNTPVQYHAALISQLAELNRWKRDITDEKSRTQLDEMLCAWKREDGGAYAGLMNQHNGISGARGPLSAKRQDAISVPHSPLSASSYASSAGAPVFVATGGSPQQESVTEALDPLTTANSPEKVSQPVDSNVVNANRPEDGWME